MKKPIITCIGLLLFSGLFAQIPKGSLGIGGSISSNLYKNFSSGGNSNSGWYVSINPSIGFFPANNFELGISPGIEIGETSYSDEYSVNFGGVGFVNKYFGDKFIKPMLGFSAGMNYSSSNNSSVFKTTTYCITGNILFGFCFFVNKSVAFRVSILNYEFSHEKRNLEPNTSFDTSETIEYTFVNNTHSLSQRIGILVIIPNKSN